MAIKTFKRVEEKYIVGEEQFHALVAKLQPYMALDKHCQAGTCYTIYNIYFDTPTNEVIRHSISKPYYKEKLRLRAYKVPKSLADEVFLEMKKKIGGVVAKRRATMTLRQAYDFIEKGIVPSVNGYINQQVVREIAYYLQMHAVERRVFIRYDRIAYFGIENKDLRLTFDNNIQTRRNELALEKGGMGESLLEEGQYVMEVKITGAVPLWLTELLSSLAIYSGSFSKYGREYKAYCLGTSINKEETEKRSA